MKRPYGITFEIGRDEKGWFLYLGRLKLLKVRPSRDGIDAKFGGLKLDIVIGKLRRPIPKFYKLDFWKRGRMPYERWEQEFNPWNSGRHWFVLSIPVFLGVFASACYGAGKRQPGLYVGTKTYEVNRISQDRKIYKPDGNDFFLPRVAWGSPNEKGSVYLCPSASIRADLVD